MCGESGGGVGVVGVRGGGWGAGGDGSERGDGGQGSPAQGGVMEASCQPEGALGPGLIQSRSSLSLGTALHSHCL